MVKEKKKVESVIGPAKYSTFPTKEGKQYFQNITSSYITSVSNPKQCNDNISPIFQQHTDQIDLQRSPKDSIKLNYIPNLKKRSLTFNKRSRGIMKKIIDLFLLTGAESLFIVSEAGSTEIYTISTEKFKSLVRENKEFKEYIIKALNTKDNYKKRQKN